jgi:hypothetical protein
MTQMQVPSLLVGLLAVVGACVPMAQQPGAGGYQGYPQQAGYPQPAGYAQPAGYQGQAGPEAVPGQGAAAQGPVAARQMRWNGVALDGRGLEIVAQLEAQYQTRIPDGDYWYDARSGAAGMWGGPAAAVLPAGLPIGGALPAQASGGGNGRLTGVFVNGRELHPMDVQALRTFTQVIPGRYWVDGQGNGGVEGGPATFNLYALAQAAQSRRGGGGNSHYMSDSNGSIWVGGGGFNSSWKSDSGRTSNSCSYDPNDGAGVMCSSSSSY